MMTPTHLIVASAVLAKRKSPGLNTAVLFGALLPDVSIFVMFIWARFFKEMTHYQIWRELYWTEPWQTISAISNSVPLFAVILLVAFLLKSKILIAFAIAALLHLALDFPVHASDAHVHFWPITDWRFHSPISYWDSRHYANIVRPAELLLGVGCMALLWWRFRSTWVRIVLVLTLVSYVAVPAYFALSNG